jgi:hypothetical protein
LESNATVSTHGHSSLSEAHILSYQHKIFELEKKNKSLYEENLTLKMSERKVSEVKPMQEVRLHHEENKINISQSPYGYDSHHHGVTVDDKENINQSRVTHSNINRCM